MDITFKKIKKARRLFARPEFAHNLYFYKTPPTETIQLQAFEDYALDRLKSKTIIKIFFTSIKLSQLEVYS